MPAPANVLLKLFLKSNRFGYSYELIIKFRFPLKKPEFFYSRKSAGRSVNKGTALRGRMVKGPVKPVIYNAGKLSLAIFTNLVYFGCQVSFMVPVGPFLCFAIITSATFLSSVSGL